MRRFDSARPSPSETIGSACLDIVEIVERLAHAHHHDVGDEAALAGTMAPAGVVGIGKVAEPVARDQDLRRRSRRRVRLRTSFCVPVWQKVQVSVQPTWLETQSVPRPSSGM